MTTPSPQTVREELASFDVRQCQVAAGLFGVLVSEPSRVRDREWVSEQLTNLVVLSEETDPETPQAGVDAAQRYLNEHADRLIEAAFLLFQRVGADLAPRASEGFTFDEAMRLALDYLPSA